MIYALHGFLGLPADWNFLKEAGFDIIAENLYSDVALKDWAPKQTLPTVKPRILLGYSMGGRIAMHLLLRNPSAWDAAIFVSANPGNVEERETRMKLDQQWAQIFLQADWSHAVNEWNKQHLFRVKKPLDTALHLQREEKDFDRAQLAHALTEWSVAKQNNLAMDLSRLKIPVLWLAGEDDEKYCRMLSGFAKVSRHHEFQIIPSAGHRAPWDNPQGFIASLHKFVSHTSLEWRRAQLK